LSDVIRHILLRKDAARYGGKVDAATRKRWEDGLAWERVFSETVAAPAGYGKLVAQQAIVKDKITGTPDFFDVDNRIAIECKRTLMSSAHAVDSPHFWGYRVQLMAYCLLCDTTRGDLVVYHVMGDYKRDEGLPESKPWKHELLFNADELRKTWRMILTNRDAMLEERRRK
jgi:hypothetical protein